MLPSLSLLPLLLGIGCDTADTASGVENDGDTSDSGGIVDTADSGGGVCSGALPSVAQFSASDGENSSDNGQPIPAINFFVAFTDTDGDVNEVNLKLWADETFDGAVDTGSKVVSEVGPVVMSLDGQPVPECEGTQGSLIFALGVTGRGMAFETKYEFGIAVIDAHGLESAPAVLVYTTPAPVE